MISPLSHIVACARLLEQKQHTDDAAATVPPRSGLPWPFLLPKLSSPSKGRRYATLDDIRTASNEELKKIKLFFRVLRRLEKPLAQVCNIWWELRWRGQNRNLWINKWLLIKHKIRDTFWTHLVRLHLMSTGIHMCMTLCSIGCISLYARFSVCICVHAGSAVRP